MLNIQDDDRGLVIEVEYITRDKGETYTPVYTIVNTDRQERIKLSNMQMSRVLQIYQLT